MGHGFGFRKAKSLPETSFQCSREQIGYESTNKYIHDEEEISSLNNVFIFTFRDHLSDRSLITKTAPVGEIPISHGHNAKTVPNRAKTSTGNS